MQKFGRLTTAFLARDLYTELSYKTSFVMSMVGVLIGTLSFYFISQLIGQPQSADLAKYGGNYFSFAIVGIALSSYFTLGLSSFASGLRNAQVTGTLEAMLMTPAPLPSIVVGSSLWSYVYETIRIFVYIFLGMLLGVQFEISNFFIVLVILLLTIVVGASIGILSAGVIMIIKRGDPIASMVGSFTALLGGVWYPVDILPDWLERLSAAIPLTYALNAMRSALLIGARWADVAPDLLILVLFCIVLFPMSLFIFRFGVDQARQDGSLAHY